MRTSKPNFLFLGPDKTGSTWIYHLLLRHHEAFVPKIKDLYYFDKNYEKGLSWYYGFFKNSKPTNIAIGELSHDYIHSRKALERIKKDLGSIKTMVCFRDPIERSVSHYLYLLHSGIVSGKNIRNELIENTSIRANSLFIEKITFWKSLFPDGLLLDFDQLKNNPISFGNLILDYLKCSPVDAVPSPKRVGSIPRNLWLAKSIKLGGRTLRKLGLLGLLGALKESNVREFAFKKTDLNLRDEVKLHVLDLWGKEFGTESVFIRNEYF